MSTLFVLAVVWLAVIVLTVVLIAVALVVDASHRRRAAARPGLSGEAARWAAGRDERAARSELRPGGDVVVLPVGRGGDGGGRAA